MNKVNGKKTSFSPLRDDGSRITICYGLKKIGKLYEWREVYLPKKTTPNITLSDIKAAIIADINNRVKTSIVSGFVRNNKPVWLSEENQMNFSQAVTPVTLKIGETAEGTPVYETFETQEAIDSFSRACTAWKQQCLSAGYAEKDGIDWAPYEALFSSGENE